MKEPQIYPVNSPAAAYFDYCLIYRAKNGDVSRCFGLNVFCNKILSKKDVRVGDTVFTNVRNYSYLESEDKGLLCFIHPSLKNKVGVFKGNHLIGYMDAKGMMDYIKEILYQGDILNLIGEMKDKLLNP